MRHLMLATLLAACGSTPAEAPATAASGRTVDVLISGAGYTPTQIDAQPGESLTLVFDRPDGANCGETVVFPATGERHEVPVGKKVAVAVTAPPSGELTFTCGMDMYRGALVVKGH